jgi:NurA domain
MPYEGEFAQYKPLRRLVESERVNKLLGSYRVRSSSDRADALEMLKPIRVQSSNWMPTWIIGIDGSHAEVDIKNGFPGAEASYITVASVLLNVEKIRELDQQRPVNPKEFRKTETAESIDCALPGCNVISEGEGSAEASLRKSIFEVFKSARMSDEGESLLDTYEALLKYKPITNPAQKCPYEDCLGERGFQRNTGQYDCSCLLARSLYSTDALRIHERMNPVGTNGSIFSEIMQTLERVWVVHILRTMEAKKWLSSLSRVAIVLDGPLAVFGQPAWISQAIYKEISRINIAVINLVQYSSSSE